MAIAILLAAGCGSDNGSGGDYTAIAQLTAAYQTASCTHLVSCHLFADQATCEKTNLRDSSFFLSQGEVSYVLAGRIRYNGNVAAACLAKVASQSCTENGLDHRETFAECLVIGETFTGTVAGGAKCSINEECISQQCTDQCTADQSCCTAGTCIGSTAPIPQKPAAIGDPCSGELSNACAEGSFCDSSTGVCAAYKPVGGTCHDSTACGDGLVCNFGTNMCMATAHLGQSCSTVQCGDEGTYCNTVTQLCTAYALLGAPCSGTSQNVCTNYETCDTTSSTCVTFPAVGASCQNSNGACNDVGTLCNEVQTCQLPAANGAACTAAFNCASTNCDTTTMKCAPVAVCQ